MVESTDEVAASGDEAGREGVRERPVGAAALPALEVDERAVERGEEGGEDLRGAGLEEGSGAIVVDSLLALAAALLTGTGCGCLSG